MDGVGFIDERKYLRVDINGEAFWSGALLGGSGQILELSTDGIGVGIADPKRLCMVGWSYGGYAALLSGAEEPSRYQCIVSIAGVSDLEMMLNDSRYFLNRKAVREQISRDPDVIGAGSPINRASEIEAPVLLFHGDRDINVPVDHGKKMAKALKRKKKLVEYIEYEDVEHSILRNAHRIDMLDRI